MANSNLPQTQLILKSDHSIQTIITHDTPEPPYPLAPSSVRVKSTLVSLSANNLSYCRGGDNPRLNWWTSFPVLPFFPAPYNDAQKYGICPVWGYATVIESTIPSITPGKVIYGYWPVSSFPTDLKFEQANAPDQWIMKSEHRKVLNMYNRYFVEPSISFEEITTEGKVQERRAWETLFRCQWECAWILSSYVFNAKLNEFKPIQPLAVDALPWSSEDADLSEAVVINLAAAGKTARGWSDILCAGRTAAFGPLGVLDVTSDPSKLTRSFPKKRTVSYAEATSPSTYSWITSLSAKKIVIVDFGGRNNAVETLYNSLLKQSIIPKENIMIMVFGPEAKVLTGEEGKAWMDSFEKLGKKMFNAAPVKDKVLALNLEGGEKEYHEKWMKAFGKWLDEGGVDGMKLKLGKGLVGKDGVEEGWVKVCEGRGGGDEAMAFQF